MDRLTKDEIAEMCEAAIGLDSNRAQENRRWTRVKAEALRDLALQCLSQESVRSEARWLPVEPTTEMERAGMLRSQESDIFNGVRALTFADCAKIYRAMIEMAPLQQPEEPKYERSGERKLGQ